MNASYRASGDGGRGGRAGGVGRRGGGGAARSVAVLGAGIVGISCALHLARRGFEVTLIDRREPGSETSSGNSGVIGRASIAPLGQPAIWRKLPRYAANRDRAVRFGPAYPARLAKQGADLEWFVRFLANCRPGAFEANARRLNDLLAHALPEHEALLAGDAGLLRRDGWLHLFRTERGFEATAGARALWYRHGVRFRVLDRGGLQDLEPHLGPVFRRGIWLPDIASVADPGQVCRRLAERFATEGGAVFRDEVRSLDPTDDGVRAVLADGELRADETVVALGPWSADLLAPLGYRLPVIRERGYHLHLAPRRDEPLGRPCLDAEGAYVVTPMAAGLRLTTGIEFSAPDAPPSPVQLDSVLPLAHEAFPVGEPVDPEPWLGARPGTPDSLPVIGRAPRHPNLWFAFGHASIGFALGPVTGRLIAEMMAGEPPLVDPAPCSALRFRRLGFGLGAGFGG